MISSEKVLQNLMKVIMPLFEEVVQDQVQVATTKIRVVYEEMAWVRDPV